MYFASDNSSAVHPKVMDAMGAANTGYAPAYGDDQIMDSARRKIRAFFQAPDAAVYLVATGTTANSLSLAVCTNPWQTIFCHAQSHINVDECNAPEFYTGGAKLTLIDSTDGLIAPTDLERAVAATVQGDVHCPQRGTVSITNLSETGTIYTAQAVADIAAVARQYGQRLHMDGARFANALVAGSATPAELTWKAGVDILSFGGTKNGLMGVEAVVMFDPEMAWEFELRRKRAGHLFSKHRFLSAQMDAYLSDNLITEMATHANAMAARLSAGILAHSKGSLIYPTHGNMVFANLPRGVHKRAMAAGAAYSFTDPGTSIDGPEADSLGSRMVCSWSTTTRDVDQFLNLISD